MRFLAGLALIAHALAHVAIWLPAYDPEKRSFDARDSWILRTEQIDERGARRAAVVVAIGCAALFALAALGFFIGAGWADEVTAGTAVISLLLTIIYFHPWLASFAVVNLAILALAL
jgi:hypothetical protein